MAGLGGVYARKDAVVQAIQLTEETAPEMARLLAPYGFEVFKQGGKVAYAEFYVRGHRRVLALNDYLGYWNGKIAPVTRQKFEEVFTKISMEQAKVLGFEPHEAPEEVQTPQPEPEPEATVPVAPSVEPAPSIDTVKTKEYTLSEIDELLASGVSKDTFDTRGDGRKGIKSRFDIA